MSDAGDASSLVEFIANNPGLADTLLSEHLDDGRGYCPACALGGQRGHRRHPCDIRRSAERAREIERG